MQLVMQRPKKHKYTPARALQIPAEWIKVDLSAMLGDGTYGEVCGAHRHGRW
jgi:hypothetical protein